VLSDGSRHPIKVVYADPESDFAIGKIDIQNASYLPLGDSDSLQVGQTVIAIGNALAQFTNSVSVGIVSGLGRSIIAGNSFGDSEEFDKVIQVDASIYPGNSGGPLLDLSGKVVGVTSARAAGSENIGFALPINAVKNVIDKHVPAAVSPSE
jgi:serine protease Do